MKNGSYTSSCASPVGRLTLASDGHALTGVWMQGQKYDGATLQAHTQQREVPIFTQTRAWLEDYFAGQKPCNHPLLAPEGSPFRKAVWKILCAIPYGQLTTYGQIARQLEQTLGKRVSAQAVGGAVGHNPISILIPCHRVVGSNGSLTGYAGGLDRKIWLLRHEGVNLDDLFVPKSGTAL